MRLFLRHRCQRARRFCVLRWAGVERVNVVIDFHVPVKPKGNGPLDASKKRAGAYIWRSAGRLCPEIGLY